MSCGLSQADSVTAPSSEVWYYTGAPERHRKTLTLSVVRCVHQWDTGANMPNGFQLWAALTINTMTVSLSLAGVMPRLDLFIKSQNNFGWKEPFWKSLILKAEPT